MNIERRVEMGASLMDDKSLQVKVTLLLTDVRNPVRGKDDNGKTVEKCFWRKRKQKTWVFFELLEKTTTDDE